MAWLAGSFFASRARAIPYKRRPKVSLNGRYGKGRETELGRVLSRATGRDSGSACLLYEALIGPERVKTRNDAESDDTRSRSEKRILGCGILNINFRRGDRLVPSWSHGGLCPHRFHDRF